MYDINRETPSSPGPNPRVLFRRRSSSVTFLRRSVLPCPRASSRSRTTARAWRSSTSRTRRRAPLPLPAFRISRASDPLAPRSSARGAGGRSRGAPPRAFRSARTLPLVPRRRSRGRGVRAEAPRRRRVANDAEKAGSDAAIRGSRTVSSGSSLSTVFAPVTIAELWARKRCTSSLAAGEVIH